MNAARIDLKPGMVIEVWVGGLPYETIVDAHGVQRFRGDPVLQHLFDTDRLDLNALTLDFANGKFSLRAYAEFYMRLGYSVGGFADLFDAPGMKIENPVWSLGHA